MQMYLNIMIGGALGSALRYWVGTLVDAWWGGGFPMGTLLINVSGSFVIGLFAALTGPDGVWLVPPTFRAFVMIGICGGFTTFSSFSLQTLNLVNSAEWLRAGLNVAGSVGLCLLAVWLGHVFATALAHR
jgi:CrcB protein